MTVKITCVITNCGDGSNGIQWVLDPVVLEKMQELSDEGNEAYASGDGLQTYELVFPDDFDLESWMNTNHLSEFTMDDFY